MERGKKNYINRNVDLISGVCKLKTLHASYA